MFELFTKKDPADTPTGKDFTSYINPASLTGLKSCLIEPSLARAAPGCRYQFLRKGYFCVDPDSTPNRLVFNRTVSLRDTWARVQKAMKKKDC